MLYIVIICWFIIPLSVFYNMPTLKIKRSHHQAYLFIYFILVFIIYLSIFTNASTILSEKQFSFFFILATNITVVIKRTLFILHISFTCLLKLFANTHILLY